jgi:hypothetical protein
MASIEGAVPTERRGGTATRGFIGYEALKLEFTLRSVPNRTSLVPAHSDAAGRIECGTHREIRNFKTYPFQLPEIAWKVSLV